MESSENYSVEEIVVIEKELQELAKQLSEIRNKLHKLAHDKWTRQCLLENNLILTNFLINARVVCAFFEIFELRARQKKAL